MPEAALREESGGLTPSGPGWFIVNVAQALAWKHELAGTFVPFDNREHRFPHFGINIHVLQPGEPNAKYHREHSRRAYKVPGC